MTEARSRWGPDATRAAGSNDAVGGRLPSVVLEPTDAAMASDMLRWAATEGRAVVIRGAGTKLGWGGLPARIDAVLSTLRLDGPIDHCAGDLTVTTPSGTRLADVNAVLARQKQWLPLDPGFVDEATIGGVVATNDSGPRRHLYGTPRDLIIGAEMALADGRRAKAGGRVVKNVAGYDLARLLCGSFGALAVITSATFKLVPAPRASRTVVADAGLAKAGALVAALGASGLTPSAIEIESPPPRLLIRFETTEAATSQQASAACDTCVKQGASVSILEGQAEAAVWRDHRALRDKPGTIVKIAVLPTQVADAITDIEQTAGQLNLDWHVSGRAALGVLYIALNTSNGTGQPAAAGLEPSRLARAVESLRERARARGGSAVIVAGSPELRGLVDPWGEIGNGLSIMRAVKARFDDRGTLNPGRGPGGI